MTGVQTCALPIWSEEHTSVLHVTAHLSQEPLPCFQLREADQRLEYNLRYLTFKFIIHTASRGITDYPKYMQRQIWPSILPHNLFHIILNTSLSYYERHVSPHGNISLAGNVGDMLATCRRHCKMSPIFVPTGQIWRHVFLCVGTLLCRVFPTLTYHEQTRFGWACY